MVLFSWLGKMPLKRLEIMKYESDSRICSLEDLIMALDKLPIPAEDLFLQSLMIFKRCSLLCTLSNKRCLVYFINWFQIKKLVFIFLRKYQSNINVSIGIYWRINAKQSEKKKEETEQIHLGRVATSFHFSISLTFPWLQSQFPSQNFVVKQRLGEKCHHAFRRKE